MLHDTISLDHEAKWRCNGCIHNTRQNIVSCQISNVFSSANEKLILFSTQLTRLTMTQVETKKRGLCSVPLTNLIYWYIYVCLAEGV
jgi:hypothetical protein